LSDVRQVRAVVRVYGYVQRVGYRFIVQDLARRMGVKGFVKNLPDGSVEIVAEASKEIVDKFVDAVRIKESPVDVARLDAVYAKATGEYDHFSLIAGDLTEEIIEGFGMGLKHINLSREGNREGFRKVDKSITAIHTDTTTMHVDLKGSITGMHKDLKGAIGDMHKDLKGGISTMHTDVKGSIDSMHEDMNKHFGDMAKRYDVVSSELIRSREELTRAVDNMSRLIDEFIKGREKEI